jgi:NAD-dependent deacetylase
MTTPAALTDAAILLAAAQRLVVFTGAGMSQESDIPTFRDPDGVWARQDPREYATPSAFRRHPERVWRWYAARRRKLQAAQPNPGHRAIAALEAHVPHVVVVTQNIDGLHQRAGSTRVLELHGSLARFKCVAACRGRPTPVPAPPLDQATPPRCPHCGALVRPAVVWFNELLPVEVWERAVQAIDASDALLIVGTSGVVEPAASLPRRAHEQGAALIEVNPEATPLTPLADVALRGKAGVVLPPLVAAVRRARGTKS